MGSLAIVCALHFPSRPLYICLRILHFIRFYSVKHVMLVIFFLFLFFYVYFDGPTTCTQHIICSREWFLCMWKMAGSDHCHFSCHFISSATTFPPSKSTHSMLYLSLCLSLSLYSFIPLFAATQFDFIALNCRNPICRKRSDSTHIGGSSSNSIMCVLQAACVHANEFRETSRRRGQHTKQKI